MAGKLTLARKMMAASWRDAWRRIREKRHSSPLKPQRPEERSLNHYVLWETYVLMAVTGLGYLALTWSTVVLLGGFVTELGKGDFWCLTVISMLQACSFFNLSIEQMTDHQTSGYATGIFNDLKDQLSTNFLDFFFNAIEYLIGIKLALDVQVRAKNSILSACINLVSILFFPVTLLVGSIYKAGPILCVVLSSERLVQRDYGSDDRDGSKANLMPALDIFYSLVICQGVLFFIWMCIDRVGMWPVSGLRRACRFPEQWGSISVSEYLFDTRAKCWQDPASINGRNLINYAVDLLDSVSQQEYLSGARMVVAFIKLEADVRSLILPSRPKIQKLIDTLGWRSSDREIRELAARIVAYLAGDIHLIQFPGAIRCISSLLDSTLPYWNKQRGPNHHSPQSTSKKTTNAKEILISNVRLMEKCRAKMVQNQEGDVQREEVDNSIHGWNELILQGLTILERLASDQHNCSDICSTPDLLPKIVAPLYSNTLIQDINISAWADVVNGSLKVVHRLIRAPEWTGRRLAYEISSSKQAVSNLEMILDQDKNAGQELQMRAIEILTELALDLSTNLTKETTENLINKQLKLFLTDDQGEEEPATEFLKKQQQQQLKVIAGKALALLSKTGFICEFIMSKYEHIVDILDAKNKIRYRTIAAEILGNLCTHHTMDKEHVKNTLLPKIITEVMTSKREPSTKASQSNLRMQRPRFFLYLKKIASQSNISAPRDNAENQEHSATGNDEENQLSRLNGQIKSSEQAKEEQTAVMELQETLLSLSLVICDKLISADEFDDMVRMIAPGEGAFAAKLKAIVEENCHATVDCLRIVKLCGQIAVSMMRRSWYTEHFKDQEFVESLSKASEIMSNLESCMLFAGTDCGVNKTVRPLLSDLAKEAHALVG